MSLEYPFLNTVGVASLNGVNPFLLAQLNKLGQQRGQVVEVFSGYRSPGYSERVGGYANDPHSRGEAVDAQINGTPIGEVVPIAMLAALGLEGGNTPGFYPRGGNGGRDPEHVQIPGSGNDKSMRSPTLHLATGNPASGNVPPQDIASRAPTSASTPTSSLYASLAHGAQTPARIVLHSTEGDAPPSGYGADWLRRGGVGAQIVVGTDGSVMRYVPDTQVAWGTQGNNTGTLNIEIVGHAANTRDQWRSNPQQLQTVAAVIAGWSKAYNIPIEVDPTTQGGISTHAMNWARYHAGDYRSDPGPGFPLGLVVAQARVYADQGKGLVPPQTSGQMTPVTEIPNYQPGSAPPVTAIPNQPAGAPVAATPLQVIRDYAPKVGLDPAAVIAYALTQGGTSWGAVGDNGSSFGPFQMHIGGAAGNRSPAEAAAWANSPQGLVDGMNMMAHAGATGKSGPEAAAFIVGPSFGRGANPTSDMAKARAAYPQAASLLKQYPGTSVVATVASGVTGTGTTPGPLPPPPVVPYVPPPPPALSPYVPTPPAAEAAIVPLAVGAAPAAGTTAPTAKTPALRPGRPAIYDPAKDLALEPAEPSGPLRRLFPVAKLGQAAAAAPGKQGGGPLRRLFPVSKLGSG